MTVVLELPPDLEATVNDRAGVQGVSIQEYVLALVERDAQMLPDDQARRQAVVAGLLAQFQAEDSPAVTDETAREAYRQSPSDEAVVGKFRRQGFNL